MNKYKGIKLAILLDVIFLAVLKVFNYQFQTWIGNWGATAIFLTPFLFLLFTLYRDKRFSENKRMLFIVIFWFIIISYVVTGMFSFALEFNLIQLTV